MLITITILAATLFTSALSADDSVVPTPYGPGIPIDLAPPSYEETLDTHGGPWFPFIPEVSVFIINPKDENAEAVLGASDGEGNIFLNATLFEDFNDLKSSGYTSTAEAMFQNVLLHETLHDNHLGQWKTHCLFKPTVEAQNACLASRRCHQKSPGCLEIFAFGVSSAFWCNLACSETDPNKKELYKYIANLNVRKGKKFIDACAAAETECGPAVFFDPTGAQIPPTPLNGYTLPGLCCCDDITMESIQCPEGDCDQNGQLDSVEIANDPTLDLDKNGQLDKCDALLTTQPKLP